MIYIPELLPTNEFAYQIPENNQSSITINSSVPPRAIKINALSAIRELRDASARFAELSRFTRHRFKKCQRSAFGLLLKGISDELFSIPAVAFVLFWECLWMQHNVPTRLTQEGCWSKNFHMNKQISFCYVQRSYATYTLKQSFFSSLM